MRKGTVKRVLAFLLVVVLSLGMLPLTSADGVEAATTKRKMEYLNRGVVAVSTGNSVFVSWRLLATEDQNIGFNVYRTTDGVTTKLNDAVLTGGTNYTDTTADLSKENTYFVRTVVNGTEQDTDGNYTLSANSIAKAITIPIKAGGQIHFVWVGDFNADGAYDYLVDRCWDDHQKLEAYLSDGTYLWTIDLGYNSENKNNITPGASTIDVGMWDGATVYDIDCDGYADVLLRIADGVTFGNGEVFASPSSHANAQYIAVIDGRTGSLKATAEVPTDYIDVGPMACMMGIGYLDGVNPSVVCFLKNRNADKSFNCIVAPYRYKNGKFVKEWQWNRGSQNCPDAHQIRISDVNYDGKDEILQMGFCLNGNGTLRYELGSKGVVHGDRYYVGKFNPNDDVMLGYGIQQDNPSGLLEYFYNASTGELLWENYAAEGTADVARGNVGDIDPNYEGFECWSFQGLYSNKGTKIASNSPYPVLRLWWDGDLLSESYNEGKIEKWNYANASVSRMETAWKITGCTGSDRGVPMFYGDIMGDWREEVVMTNYDYSALVILSTTVPTETRLYTLAQNPAYRDCMTIKGYVQSHMLDYYLGEGMSKPSLPNIEIIDKDKVADKFEGIYYIKNDNSNLYLDVKDGSAANGANIQQSAYNGSDAQRFKIVSNRDGYYYILTGASSYTSCVDIEGVSSKNGANVFQWEYLGGDNQLYKIQENADGTYAFLTKITKNKGALDVYDSSTQSGGNVNQWTYWGSANQNWHLEPVIDGTYYIQNVYSEKYLDVVNGNSANGTNIQQYSFNGSDAQKFKIVSNGDGYYYILTAASGYKSCVDVEGISSANGANVFQWEYLGGDNQLYKIQENPDGSYAFLTKITKNKSALDVYNWSKANGGNINQWEYWGGELQHWYLIDAE